MDVTKKKELIDRMRKASKAVYLATDAAVADDLSAMLRKASDELEKNLEYNVISPESLNIVAKALYEDRDGEYSWESLASTFRVSYINEARVAIEAWRGYSVT